MTIGTIPNVYTVPRRRKRIRRLRWMLVRIDALERRKADELGLGPGDRTDDDGLEALRAERSALLWVLDLLDPPIKACPQCGASSAEEALMKCASTAAAPCPMAGPGTWEDNLREVNEQHRGAGASLEWAEDWLALEQREQARRRAAKAQLHTEAQP